MKNGATGPHILLIEDEADIANLIEIILEQENFMVSCAHNGNRGYHKVITGNYDLVILDLNLPDISGIEVCYKIRKVNLTIPILVLTVKYTTKDKVEALNIGADDYLTKPFEPSELVARIRSLIRRSKKGKKYLTLGELTVYLPEKSVKRKGEAIKLSNTEFSLLEYLLTNRGRIVTKDQILDHLFKEDDKEDLGSVVYSHLRNLRQLVEYLSQEQKENSEEITVSNYIKNLHSMIGYFSEDNEKNTDNKVIHEHIANMCQFIDYIFRQGEEEKGKATSALFAHLRNFRLLLEYLSEEDRKEEELSPALANHIKKLRHLLEYLHKIREKKVKLNTSIMYKHLKNFSHLIKYFSKNNKEEKDKLNCLLYTHIKNLRRKINDKDGKIIKTVYGNGYII